MKSLTCPNHLPSLPKVSSSFIFFYRCSLHMSVCVCAYMYLFFSLITQMGPYLLFFTLIFLLNIIFWKLFHISTQRDSWFLLFHYVVVPQSF